jgi:hypothetical protein
MRTAIVLAAALTATWLSFGAARAEPAGPPALATPARMNVAVPIGLQLGLPYVSWEPVEGAAGYRLSGEVHMLRTNRNDPFCAPPVKDDTHTITLDSDELIPPEIDHVDLPVPELPADDAWYIFDAQALVEAVDEDGGVLASGRIGGTAETLCSRPTPTPAIVLPPTGSGGGSASFALPAAVTALTLAAGAALAASLRLRLRSR